MARFDRSIVVLFVVLASACGKRSAPPLLRSASREIVVLPNSMVVQAKESELSGVGPDGNVKWTAHVAAPEVVVGKPAAAPNSTLYVRTSTSLRALSADGEWLWKMPLATPHGEPLPYSPAAMTDSAAVVLVEGQTYRSYARSGEARWEVALDANERVHGVPQVTPDGQIYVITDQSLYSISPEGRISWRLSR